MLPGPAENFTHQPGEMENYGLRFPILEQTEIHSQFAVQRDQLPWRVS